MAEQVEKFQRSIADCFQQLVLATAYAGLGQQVAYGAGPAASVSLMLGGGVVTEPILLRELQRHSDAVKQGIAELFQTKAIAAWADLLNELFAHVVGLHFSGKIAASQLKRRKVHVDFSQEMTMEQQVRQALVSDFAFDDYQNRVRTITSVLPPSAGVNSELAFIRKHVLIRNAVQHHGSRVGADMLRQLGCARLESLNSEGNASSTVEGDAIHLHLPELDRLKGAMFQVSNEWRDQVDALSA